MNKDIHKLDIGDKISHLLEEARMVLPGTQALLGFQLIAFLSPGFEKIPFELKFLHLISLGFVGLASIFLMAPAAYHRIVEKSKAMEKFNIYGSRMIILALFALSVGLSLDVSIVSYVVLQSALSFYIGASVFIVSCLIWFILPLYSKKLLF